MSDESPLDRVGYKLDKWRRQLIDLSRRNKLLNYRPTKRSTVEVVDELPHQVLRQLLDGEIFKFDPAPREVPEERFEDRPESLNRRVASEVKQNPPVRERDLDTRRTLGDSNSGEFHEHHTDDRLQTRYTKERLESNLTKIYREAASSLEEQGVNTLFLALGMLEWYESRSYDKNSLAPLILVPVTLDRDTAASPFTLQLRDEEPVLNPALVERLKQDFSIELSELPDLAADIEVETLFGDVRDAVSGFEHWRLTRDVVLGQFSFQKFMMFKDLERHVERFREKDIIRSICMEEEEELRLDLPPEIREAALDEEMSPWDTVQIRDSDSSQQRAMLAVRKGQNLVIEGPPGTGKSQTISNIIADQLAEGHTVLFVSEKMAALEVVKARLDAADLGAFCLELHSNKTQKTQFVGELRKALSVQGETEEDYAKDLERLKRLTGELRAYVEDLHRPVQPIGWSPFDAIARLTEVEDATRVIASIPELMEIGSDQYEEALEDLQRLARTLRDVGDPGDHPLRGFGLTHVSRIQEDELKRQVEIVGKAVAELTEAASDAAESFGFTVPETLGDVDLMLEGSAVIAESPGAEVSVLENPRWNEMSAEVQRILEVGERYAERRETVNIRFKPEIWDRDTRKIADRYEEHLESGVIRFIKPSFWRARSDARSLALPEYDPDRAEELIDDFRTASDCKDDREWLSSQDELGRDLFGGHWDGPESDWTELRDFAEWIVELRKYALEEVLAERGFQMAAEANLDSNTREEHHGAVRDALDKAKDELLELIEAGKIDGHVSKIEVVPAASIGRIGRRIDEVEVNLDRLQSFSRFRFARDKVADGPAGPFAERVESQGLDSDSLVPAFKRLFLERWIDEVIKDRRALREFRSGDHDRRLRRFRKLDERSKEIAKVRGRQALMNKRKRVLSSDLLGQLQRVQKEAKKQRKILPIRKLLRRSPDVIQLIKPCFMMSPLSVAKYLDPEIYEFDLLVFDEASQIPPADAVGSMIRADRVVVVGDEKQLPPTQFFDPDLEGDDGVDDEELELLEDMESILEQVAVSGVPSVRLKWHYRSEHESLIRFSNEKFYEDDPLYTFPHPVRDDDHSGLQFEYLKNAAYAGRGRNPVEARRVADAVVEHIRNHSDLSLGVGTFGMAQQRLVQDELDQRRREHPEIEWFFSQTGEDKFFVKNLENIQGDDRDVIFLSVTYGPDEDGVLRRNFGPINRDGGWKRLNVLTTRAKKRLRVFSSMRGDDIDPAGIARGARLLREYLKYAETGDMPASNVSMGPPESPFERAVKTEIQELGFEVVSQVGESPYRIDLGVVDPDNPGRFLCGIECDGATYHRQQTVRDRDRIRQQVLQDRGWQIHRIWSTDWFRDRAGQVVRLERLLDESLHTGKDDRGSVPPNGCRTSSRPCPDQELLEEDDQDSPPGLSDDHKTSLDEIEIPAYSVARPSRRGESDAFYQASPSQIARVVEEVLQVEAPMPFRMLARRVASAWGLSQAGSTIRGRVEKGVERLKRSGRVQRSGRFVTLAGRSEPTVRSRAIDEISFQTKHLPPQEVDEAVRLLLRHRAPLLPDDIPAETARLLGFKRTGRQLRKVVESAVVRLTKGGDIEATGLGLRLVGQESPPTQKRKLENRVNTSSDIRLQADPDSKGTDGSAATT